MGDTEPEALWQLCPRYRDSRPYAPIAHIVTLYKLREWYAEHREVKSGEVQWRLAERLHCWVDGARRASSQPRAKGTHWRGPYDHVYNEAMHLIETRSKHQRVTGGDALWAAAEARRKQGYETLPSEAADVWKDARARFMEFQRKHPKHGRHTKSPTTGVSEWQRKVRELNKKIK